MSPAPTLTTEGIRARLAEIDGRMRALLGDVELEAKRQEIARRLDEEKQRDREAAERAVEISRLVERRLGERSDDE